MNEKRIRCVPQDSKKRIGWRKDSSKLMLMNGIDNPQVSWFPGGSVGTEKSLTMTDGGVLSSVSGSYLEILEDGRCT